MGLAATIYVWNLFSCMVRRRIKDMPKASLPKVWPLSEPGKGNNHCISATFGCQKDLTYVKKFSQDHGEPQLCEEGFLKSTDSPQICTESFSNLLRASNVNRVSLKPPISLLHVLRVS
jgi:hypothetical protein